LKFFPARATRTDNFPQITARFDEPLRMAKGAAGFEFWGSSIAMMKGRLNGSLSIHPAVDFPSPAHSVAFYNVKRHIFWFAAGGAGTDLLPSALCVAIIKMPFEGWRA
jgi:hypothetical protein